jgi:hypothetical protein
MDLHEAIEVAMNSTAEGQDRLAAAYEIATSMAVSDIEQARSGLHEARQAMAEMHESVYAMDQADEVLAQASELRVRGKTVEIQAKSYRDHEQLMRYMPGNYTVIDRGAGENALVVGLDRAGWTMDAYVIPRLGSGLIWPVLRETDNRPDVRSVVG